MAKKKFKLRRRRKPKMKIPSLSPPWIELPTDVTANILHRLGAVEILESAQKVCTTWRTVCKEPAMWRSIDMRNLGDLHDMPYDLEIMCRHAVDRSQGQLIDINIEYFGTDELLHYISERSSQLRRLRLAICYDISGEGLSDGLQAILDGCPHLESLDLRQCFNVVLEGDFGKRCSQQIKDLRHPFDSTDDYEWDSKIYDDEQFYDSEYSDNYSVGDYEDYSHFFGTEYFSEDEALYYF